MMMKKTILVLSLVTLLMFAFTGCESNEPGTDVGNQPDANSTAGLVDLLNDYQEESETGALIMQSLKEEPVLFVEAMAESTNTEQLLVLVGSTIAEARRGDAAAYDEYMSALATAADAPLSDAARQMLGFIHANIDIW
jgi:hypothetical protein